METSIDYIDHTVAVVSTDEPKWHRRLRAFKAQYPNEVTIKTEPETNDGNMVATVPVKWVNIRPPRRLDLTDEQRAERAEKLRNSMAKHGVTTYSGTNEEEEEDGED